LAIFAVGILSGSLKRVSSSKMGRFSASLILLGVCVIVSPVSAPGEPFLKQNLHFVLRVRTEF